MALTYRALFKNYYYLQNITKPVKWSVGEKYPVRSMAIGPCYHNEYNPRPLLEAKDLTIQATSLRLYSTQDKPPSDGEPTKVKVGLIQKFKVMYRDYWYVLIPVHVATSIIWFGSFYYVVRSGVDVLALLKTLGVSETIIVPLRDSAAGYFALALALYKLATPLRYTVTVGGTTVAIKKLKELGFIKPVPSRERIKEIFQEKKDTLQDRFNESKTHYQTQMKERRTQVLQEMKRYKTEMRNMKKNKTQPKQ
ncbi:unnamed protein product [Spodoptera littoralis]|uniref:DUF1279 domain-containing protein n=1 Tax=Spodoptera littoralis TaxID=7109 RepID=A0A9P0IEK5_SPOLI|nr:unnamed protein product [Spodoptera littoralis]CAH1644774.1 unnamed protein product [Spodoptera littoralis]